MSSRLDIAASAPARAAGAPAVAGRTVPARRRAVLWCLVAFVLLVAAAAVAAPWLAPYDPAQVDFSDRFAAPSRAHLLGTDNLGRDELSRLLYGARLSLFTAVAATAGVTLLGTCLGLVAGMFGRVVDTLVSRLVDILMAIPTFVLALVVVGLLGKGTTNLIIAIVLVGWAGYARLVRGMTLSLRERGYVEAARALGATDTRILLRHVAPNLLGPVIVLSTLDLGRVLLAVSGLSFLGLGIEPPTPEWGAMLAEARTYIDRAPQLLAYPGLAITVMVLAVNLGGDALRDVLDPLPSYDLLPRRRRGSRLIPRRFKANRLTAERPTRRPVRR